MSKIVKLETRIEERLDGVDVEVQKIGEDTYRISTGAPEEHNFRNTIRAKEFDRNFVEAFNKVSESEDQFELTGNDAYRVLRELRNRLERGEISIRLKVQN